MDISEDKIRILNDLEKNTVTIINGEAGTGKTFIGSLGGQKILEGSKAWEKALYLTYSKLAKRQINYTIKKLCDAKHLNAEFIKKMEVMTYHSFWWHLINRYYCFLGFSRKPILNTKNELDSFREEILRQIPEKIILESFLTKKNTINKRKEAKIKEVLSGLGALYYQFEAKNFGKNAEDFIEADQFLEWCKDQIFVRNRAGFFSHDETVCWAHKLLLIHPNLKSLIREKYPVFIFDEFQDTDVAQWEIIKLINPKTIIVLGDPAQTIHQWRGADPERMNQLREFFENYCSYIRVETKLLRIQYRSSKNMSNAENISWKYIYGDPEKEKFKLKWYAKKACKDIVTNVDRNKNVAVFCLTNKMADDVTNFFRTSKYLNPIRCSRYGANYSPFDKARSLILDILDIIEKKDTKKFQDYLANTIFKELFLSKLVRCSSKSKNDEPTKRWELAVKLSAIFLNDFGDGLIKLKKFVEYIETRVRFYCDGIILRIFKKVGESIQRLRDNQWSSLSHIEKRSKVDSIILKYENAIAEYQNDKVSIMTIHQAKGQEFDNIIIFWFSNIAWDDSEGISWNTFDQEHVNLFHTGCTRARDKVFVITPKGFTPSWPPKK